jgi:hypothetical protein
MSRNRGFLKSARGSYTREKKLNSVPFGEFYHVEHLFCKTQTFDFVLNTTMPYCALYLSVESMLLVDHRGRVDSSQLFEIPKWSAAPLTVGFLNRQFDS